MAKVKTYRFGDKKAPKFPTKFKIASKAVLQKTDVKQNNNKYYAIELHEPTTKKKTSFRVFTHYGRTDDLDTNPDAGVKECRFFKSLEEAQYCYDSIFRQKTGASKGYKELSLASSNIGSKQARGQSVGKVDDKTLAKGKKTKKKAAKKKVPKKAAVKLSPAVKSIVEYLFSEATTALTKTVNVTITANGIETPLGILTLGQIEKGQRVLDLVNDELKKKRKRKAKLQQLSSDFYTLIPHRIGRSRKAIEAAVVSTSQALVEKNDTLQLMRDMLSVSGGEDAKQDGNVLYDGTIADQYQALGCQIKALPKSSAEYKKWAKYVLDNQEFKSGMKIVNLYKIKRSQEHKEYKTKVGNHRYLFHGSNIRNWVGILSRGILMPKAVVSMGGSRTDAGWLGAGIYFGSESTTSANYTAPGSKSTSIMAINRVALGRVKEFTKITYGITKPPKNFDSCHGVQCSDDVMSDFDDNEYVIYDPKQQRLEILVEFK